MGGKFINPRDPITERQRMSKGCRITETKRKVFRFHETILRFGELIGSLGQDGSILPYNTGVINFHFVPCEFFSDSRGT